MDLIAGNEPISRKSQLIHRDSAVTAPFARSSPDPKPQFRDSIKPVAQPAPARKECVANTGIVIENAQSDHRSATISRIGVRIKPRRMRQTRAKRAPRP